MKPARQNSAVFFIFLKWFITILLSEKAVVLQMTQKQFGRVFNYFVFIFFDIFEVKKLYSSQNHNELKKIFKQWSLLLAKQTFPRWAM